MLMEEKQAANPVNSLRPHHALCALFFEGQGYSRVFVENMSAFLADPSQMLQITAECDILCQACPNNQHGQCSDEAKVALFDQRTLKLTDGLFEVGKSARLDALCQDVFDHILQQGLLAEVCGECEWAALCQGKWQRRDYNRQLLQSDAASSHPC